MVLFQDEVKYSAEDSKYWKPPEGESTITITGVPTERTEPDLNDPKVMKTKLDVPITVDGKAKIWTITKTRIKVKNSSYNRGKYAQLSKLEAENGDLINRPIIVTRVGADLNSVYLFKLKGWFNGPSLQQSRELR